MNRVSPIVTALALALATVPAAPAAAQTRRSAPAGQFDYYVLSLSWSPSWCREADNAERAPQCTPGRRTGFVVHGLWPQNDRGWPEYCVTGERDPARRDSEGMADIMGSGGLAWYQWQKHGRCSGLSARGYYQTLRDAAASVRVPPLFRMLPRDITLSAPVIEDAFIEANPGLTREGISVRCTGEAIDEVRICLTRDLALRPCAPDTRRDCDRRMLMEAPR